MVAAPGARALAKAVIVGGGPAGDAVAAGLRDGGFQGELMLIGSEPELPYERPHLSKGFLLGTVPPDRLGLRPREQYGELAVELVLRDRVVELDLDRRRVGTEAGRHEGWDLLCITTGSSARTLAGFDDAIYVRELPDAVQLREILEQHSHLNVVGAGFIGCEVAAAAREKGCDVTVFEALDEPLTRVVGDDLGGFIADVHRRHRVDLRLGVTAPPNLGWPLVVGAGSVPRTELAAAAGIEVDAGILVDELGRTSVQDVFAAGDVTRFWSPLFEERIRVEHFQTAQRQGFAVGRTMAGAASPYIEAPWFWSDQYDINLQYAGAGLSWDETVTRGALGSPPFSVFYLRQGRLIAVAGINDRHTVSRARHAMEARVAISPQQLADPAFDLRRALR
ncbi:MAG TPA: FAD-dependent oxidoreductase [Candidatus Dormibacteraeota bacterium]|nr:FAD-dependent oxidoreductase [Candidatus Dormibacteraeota bacterium]